MLFRMAFAFFGLFSLQTQVYAGKNPLLPGEIEASQKKARADCQQPAAPSIPAENEIFLHDSGEFRRFRFSPASLYTLGSKEDGTVAIWANRTGRLLDRMQTHSFEKYIFTPNAKWLVVPEGQNFSMIHLETEKTLHVPADSISLHSQYFQVQIKPGVYDFIESDTAEVLARVQSKWPGRLYPLAFGQDSSKVLYPNLTVFDILTQTKTILQGIDRSSVQELDFSPNGLYIVGVLSTETTVLWDAASLELKGRIPGRIYAWSASENPLVLTFQPKTSECKAYDLNFFKEIVSYPCTGIKADENAVSPQTTVHFSSENRHIVSITSSESTPYFKIFDVEKASEIFTGSGILYLMEPDGNVSYLISQNPNLILNLRTTAQIEYPKHFNLQDYSCYEEFCVLNFEHKDQKSEKGQTFGLFNFKTQELLFSPSGSYLDYRLFEEDGLFVTIEKNRVRFLDLSTLKEGNSRTTEGQYSLSHHRASVVLEFAQGHTQMIDLRTNLVLERFSGEVIEQSLLGSTMLVKRGSQGAFILKFGSQ